MAEKDILNIKNKICIVTGGCGLIGSAFVNSLAQHGAKVIVADITDTKMDKNKNVLFFKCDTTNKKDIDNLIKFVLNKFNKIDALVNSAYPRNKNYGRKFEDVNFEDFCENVNSHMGGYFIMSKEVSKQMKKQKFGKIIIMSSIYGFAAPRFEIYKGTPMTMPVEYAAIKGGLLNLTKYLASYLGKYNIQVNAISPGGIFDGQPASFVRQYVKKVVLGQKMALPQDIIGALLFLVSDSSNYITGQNITIDGGWSL